MTTLRIYDHGDGALALDLSDLIDLLAPRSLEANWTVSPVRLTDPNGGSWDEFMITGPSQLGQTPHQMEVLATNGSSISGESFSKVAHAADQVVWGQFVATLPGQSDAWIDIRAIDSTFYEVTTSDGAVLDAVRSAFKDVRIAASPTASTPIPSV